MSHSSNGGSFEYRSRDIKQSNIDSKTLAISFCTIPCLSSFSDLTVKAVNAIKYYN
jgi:hypothetical protein